jgi:hypothetical protein
MSIIVNDKFFEVGSERWKLGGDFKSVLRDMSLLTAAEKGNELNAQSLLLGFMSGMFDSVRRIERAAKPRNTRGDNAPR